jgi:hypothetical protein
MTDPPSDAQRLLWRGARVLGMNPFGEEARSLSAFQLRWALLRSVEESGKDPLKEAKDAKAEQLSKDALALVVWVDSHTSQTHDRPLSGGVLR